MPCKVKIKDNVESFVDKYSQRGLSMSLQDANKLASNINAKMKYHVVNFYNDGGKVARTINVPGELVDRYFDIEVKRRTPVTSNINTIVKDGVLELFESNPELANIGTQEQYSAYVDSIFPDSQVKNIVYHGTKAEFDKFDKSKLGSNLGYLSSDTKRGFYFGTLKEARGYGMVYSAEKGRQRIISSILNIKNPKIVTSEEYVNIANKYADDKNVARRQEPRNFESKLVNPLIDLALRNNNDGLVLEDIFDYSKGTQQLVFEPEQIHILGSKQDIEGFKNFVDSRPTASTNKFELDIKNLNLTPEVVNYLYQDSRAKSQGRDIENYKKEISKIINNLQSDFTNSEILETLKCI